MGVRTETGLWYREDEYDAIVAELERYKHALWEANGYRIQAGLEPVKLSYPRLIQDVSQDQ